MRPPEVLVVDDELPQRRMLRALLSGQGFRSHSASSALEALSLIRRARPSLLLIDISMPKISGIKLLEILRSAPETAGLPVILMTGLAVPNEMAAAAAKGLSIGPIFIKGGDALKLAERIRGMLKTGMDAPPVVEPPGVLRRGRLTADPEMHKAWYDGKPIELHGRSLFDLLCTLIRHSEPLSREALRLLLWSESDSSGIVYVSIQRLRQTLAAYPAIQIQATAFGYFLTVASAIPTIEPPSKNTP